MQENKKRYRRAGLLSQISHPFVQHWHACRFHGNKMNAHPRPRTRKRDPPHPRHGRTSAYDFQSDFRAFRERVGRFDETAEHGDVPEMCSQVRIQLQVGKFDACGKRVSRRAMMVCRDDDKCSRLRRILCQSVPHSNRKGIVRKHGEGNDGELTD